MVAVMQAGIVIRTSEGANQNAQVETSQTASATAPVVFMFAILNKLHKPKMSAQHFM